MVGPVTVKRPTQLPPDLESFVNNSGGYGFVMVCFGSYVEAALGKEKLAMLASAFGKLKQRVLWKLNKGDSNAILFSLLYSLIVSITKFSIVISYPRAYLSRNRCTITWVSNYRCPI